MTATAIDGVLLLAEILASYGHTEVEYVTFDGARAIGRTVDSPEYVFIRQVGGVTHHTDSSYGVTLEFVLYARENPANNRDSQRRHNLLQSQLKDAWGKKFTHGGIHHFTNRVSPYRQDIPGIPYGVGRTVSQFDFVLRTSEGWA